MRRLNTKFLSSGAHSSNSSNTMKVKDKKIVTMLAKPGNLQLSTICIKPSIFKFPRLSILCSAIEEVCLHINCK
jgi:hypothetical protein